MAVNLIPGTRAVVVIDPVTGLPGGIAVDFPAGLATEATLAAVLAKLIAAPATEATLAAVLAKLIAAPATEAKQDAAVTALGTLGTEATLAAVLAKIIAAPATEGKQDALKGIVGALGDAKVLDPDAVSASVAALLRGILDRVSPGQMAAAGSISVVLASDDAAAASLAVLDDWDEADRAKVNLIAGQAGISAGAGAVAAATPRVTLASDDPLVAKTPGLGAVASAAPASVASSAVSGVILAANASRKGVTIVNTDPNDLYLRLEAAVATTALGGFNVIVPANGGEWIMDQPIYTGEIRGIWSADGAGGAAITEFA